MVRKPWERKRVTVRLGIRADDVAVGRRYSADMAIPEEKKLIDLLALAIHQAHTHDRDHPHNGQKWPQLVLSTEEANHYAKAVINALAESGLQIVEKTHNADSR